MCAHGTTLHFPRGSAKTLSSTRHLPRIAEAAGIGPGWGALEVGPGIGVLTEQLCKRADKVVSIEVDKRLPPILAETMAEYENFKLVLGRCAESGPAHPTGGRIW